MKDGGSVHFCASISIFLRPFDSLSTYNMTRVLPLCAFAFPFFRECRNSVRHLGADLTNNDLQLNPRNDRCQDDSTFTMS